MDTVAREQAHDNPEDAGRGPKNWLREFQAAGGQMLGGGRASEPTLGMEGLLPVLVNLLRHYIRLEAAANQLAQARERHRRPVPSALEQLERQRRHLATELHTGVAQLLSAIRLQVEIAAAHLPTSNPVLEKALERIATLNADALEQVRTIAQRLHPPQWQRLPLESALEQLWNLSGIPERFESHLRIQPLEHQPDLDSKTVMYRAAQEAISNVIRHSQATRVDAALEVRGSHLALIFEDNGVGFDAERLFSAPPSLNQGIGLRTIREQAEALGGSFQITTGPGGTRLEVSVPLRP